MNVVPIQTRLYLEVGSKKKKKALLRRHLRELKVCRNHIQIGFEKLHP